MSDLLHISYAVEKYNYTNISLNQEHLLQLQVPLQKLNDLIGMESIKSNIFNQLIFFLQNIEPQFPQMLHTCIQGPPGCGKTELANILADIYANLGIIKEAKVVVARRSDLVAGFLGQTAMKTQEVIDSAKGGVLLIDEAYSLGNEEKKDSFAKECIDTINQNLTEGKADFICIIAGYKEDLEKSFFGFNSGLERRFPYRLTIEDYTPEDLCKIYQTILSRSDWKIKEDDEKKMVEFFRKERVSFKFNGGDLENFVHFSKLAYARNKIFKVGDNQKIIQMDDVLVAFEIYVANKNKVGKEGSAPPMFMYT
jgi:SpoVK/Ycf46/Vps4 family AAA+-type ATPase